MPELLVELLSEEIPARMQDTACRDFRRLVVEGLEAAELGHDRVRSFATPRRLALVVDGLPKRRPDRREERRGPRVGAPERALRGFLESAGLSDPSQCEIRRQGKAEYYFAVRTEPGGWTAEVLPGIITGAITGLEWPKSMRWADGTVRYVRPLRNILAVFTGEPLDGELELGGTLGRLAFTGHTHGHRFMAPDRIDVVDFAGYEAALRAAKVILDAGERAERIRSAAPAGTRLTGRLVAENAGLTEWPVPGAGDFDPAFLDMPPEVLATSMEIHQRYFCIEDGNGVLLPRFAYVANIEAPDGNAGIRAGNERVLRARLSDAKYFWDRDRAGSHPRRIRDLDGIVFHAGLGTMADKARRIRRLARDCARWIPGCDGRLAAKAALLAKADLVTGMVGEFPELQGVMGRYYALANGLDAQIAGAAADHYRPRGQGDAVPCAPVSMAVALADRLDTLAGFFSIGRRPTGSRDPFALRRAALGVIRIILENRLRIPLREAFGLACAGFAGPTRVGQELLEFLGDRLKVHLRGLGTRHDLVAAVFAPGDEDDLVRLVERVSFLGSFVGSGDGADLLVAYRRARNILSIEERSDGPFDPASVDPGAFTQDGERVLLEALEQARAGSERAIASEDYAAATGSLALLRGPVDRFFAEVTVNSGVPSERANRLALLAGIRAAMERIADFSLVEG